MRGRGVPAWAAGIVLLTAGVGGTACEPERPLPRVASASSELTDLRILVLPHSGSQRDEATTRAVASVRKSLTSARYRLASRPTDADARAFVHVLVQTDGGDRRVTVTLFLTDGDGKKIDELSTAYTTSDGRADAERLSELVAQMSERGKLVKFARALKATRAKGDVEAEERADVDPADLAPPAPPVPPAPEPKPVTAPSFALSVDGTVRFLAFRGSSGGPSTGSDGAVYGATNQLAFKVQPIVVAGVRAGLTLPDAKGWESFGLRSSYETDRAFSSGGNVSSTNSLSTTIGAKGGYADLIDAALHVSGVGFEAEYATFTAGRVQLQDVATGTPRDDAPLTFTRTRLEASFNLGPYFTKPPKDLSLTQRDTVVLLADYYSARLPRIVYLTANRPGPLDENGVATQRATVVAETLPQPVTLSIGAVGPLGRWVPFRGVDGYLAFQGATLFGAARPSFYLPARISAPASADNRVDYAATAFGFIGRVGTDFEVRLAGDDVSVWFGGQIQGEMYFASVEVPGEYAGQVGFQDFFISGRGFFSLHYDGR